jgi:hypothetical protein
MELIIMTPTRTEIEMTVKQTILGLIGAMGPQTRGSMSYEVREQTIGIETSKHAAEAVEDAVSKMVQSGELVTETDEGIKWYATRDQAPWL